VKTSHRRALAASSVPVVALAALFVGQASASAATSAPAVAPASSAASAGVARSVSSGLLKIGSKGKAVLAAQRRLSALGYYLGSLDGVYGPATAHAVTALQKVAACRGTASSARGRRPRSRGASGPPPGRSGATRSRST